jgi:hypothetical protein
MPISNTSISPVPPVFPSPLSIGTRVIVYYGKDRFVLREVLEGWMKRKAEARKKVRRACTNNILVGKYIPGRVRPHNGLQSSTC